MLKLSTLALVVITVVTVTVTSGEEDDTKKLEAETAIKNFISAYQAGEAVDINSVLTLPPAAILDECVTIARDTDQKVAAQMARIAFMVYKKHEDNNIRQDVAVVLSKIARLRSERYPDRVALSLLNELDDKYLRFEEVHALLTEEFSDAENVSPLLILIIGRSVVDVNKVDASIKERVLELAQVDKKEQIEYESTRWASRLVLARWGDDMALKLVMDALRHDQNVVRQAMQHPSFAVYIENKEATEYLVNMLFIEKRLPELDGLPGPHYAVRAFPLVVHHLNGSPVKEKQDGTYSIDDLKTLREWIVKQRVLTFTYGGNRIVVPVSELKTDMDE